MGEVEFFEYILNPRPRLGHKGGELFGKIYKGVGNIGDYKGDKQNYQAEGDKVGKRKAERTFRPSYKGFFAVVHKPERLVFKGIKQNVQHKGYAQRGYNRACDRENTPDKGKQAVIILHGGKNTGAEQKYKQNFFNIFRI